MLSVPYGLEGRSIILFLGGRRLWHSHMLTPAERKQFHFRMPPCVFQSTSPDKLFTRILLHKPLNEHTDVCSLSLYLSFDFFFGFFIFAQQKQKFCLNHILGDLEEFLFFGTRHDISQNKNQPTSLTVSPE